MAEKDITTKVLEDHNDVFADIFNTLVFKENLVKEDELKAGATASQYKDGVGGSREQQRDVLKFCTGTKSELCLCSLGVENQVKIDKTMPIRIMNYDSVEYKRQLQGNETLHPVITIVLNFSNTKWNAPTSLLDLMDVPEKVKELVQDYRIKVFDIAFLEDSVIDRFKSDFRVVAKFFKSNRLGKQDDIFKDKQVLKYVEDVLAMLHAFTGNDNYERIYTEQLKQKVKEGEKIAMTDIGALMMERAEKKGREEGIEKGREELFKRMLSGGGTPEQLAALSGYDLEEILRVQKKMQEEENTFPTATMNSF